MKVGIELKATQMMQGKIDEQLIQCGGEMNYLAKGTIIKFKDAEIEYQMTILKDKILIYRNHQKMIFEWGKKTKSSIQTAYGIINMQIDTQKIHVLKEDENITKVLLEYEINLEGQIQYQNKIEIKIVNKN